MKKLGFFVLCTMVLSLSCKKTAEESIDCLVELILTTVSYTANPNNPKEITLMVNYGGEFNISVLWEYGDGTSETKVGTSTIHYYAGAGAYDVKANITLSGEHHSSCSTSRSKTVDVY